MLIDLLSYLAAAKYDDDVHASQKTRELRLFFVMRTNLNLI